MMDAPDARLGAAIVLTFCSAFWAAVAIAFAKIMETGNGR